MRILFDNVNFDSRSGPNSFGRKLAVALSHRGNIIVTAHENPEIQLAFIQASGIHAPDIVQRLDGIWFNSDQDWKTQNEPIRQTYKISRSVVYQTDFNKMLVESFFGEHQSSYVVRNGTDVELIESIDPMYVPSLVGEVDKVWSCASTWRPHKRLKENIRYFLEHAGAKDCLVIAGSNPDVRIAHPRIFYAGDLDYLTLLSMYKATDYFLHLAWLDHCPNVVVDARAAGAHVICSSVGGTKEIAGSNSTIIEELEWDFKPCKLYSPPDLDFSKKLVNEIEHSIDIRDVAESYEGILRDAITL